MGIKNKIKKLVKSLFIKEINDQKILLGKINSKINNLNSNSSIIDNEFKVFHNGEKME